MRSKDKFKDNAEFPIAAFDFDGTINIGGEGTYPECGWVRHDAREVINYMHALGIKIVIWTSRDVAYNQDEKKMYDHLTPMLNFLSENDIHYDAINKSIQFAPYHYNGRKIYANMYIDDRAYGWIESDHVMIDVFKSFMTDIIGMNDDLLSVIIGEIKSGNMTDNTLRKARSYVASYKDWEECIDENGSYAVSKIRVSGTNRFENVMVDTRDYELLITGNKWIINKNGYIVRKYRCGGGKYVTEYLHRLIMGNPPIGVVDHIDGNTLNCRKYNLRKCDQSDNAKNMRTPITNTSGIKGVTYDKTRDKWRAEICVNYKKILVGRFNSFEDAANARRNAESLYFGQYNSEVQ